jgi:hypothetical protein
MVKLKYISILVIMTMMLSLLAACGGENPTATPIPPTATAVPPTATAVPPTATTEAMMGTTPEATTGTGGASGGASGGMAATPADVALIQQAVTATQELKSYHFTMMASGDIMTQPVQLEGDFVAPDKLYVKGTAEGKQIEQVVSGGKAYQKDASGKWAEVQPTPEATPSGLGGAGLGGALPGVNPNDLVQDPNIIKSLAPLLTSVGGFSDTQQDETINGVSTKHYTFKMDAASMMRAQGGAESLPPNMQDVSFGGGGFWIDPQTKYLHKLDMTIDFAGLMKFMFDAMAAAFGGTATPGGEQPTPTPAVNITISVTISKHNDPSITVPTVP